MIISFIGVILIIFSVVRDEGLSVIGLIAGIVILLFGLLVISASAEQSRARANKTRYWAYGEAPDWARGNNRRGRK